MKRKLAKLLYFLYLKTLNKKKWIDGCELVFNIEGHNYYKYKDSGKIPMKRLEELQVKVLMLQNRLDKNEFDLLTNIIEESVQRALDSFNQTNRMSGLQDAIFAVQEMKSRKDDLMFHPGILMEIAGLMIIRDDENPTIVNELLTNEKVELFTKQSNTLDFFLQSGLMEFLPNSKELINASKEQLTAYQNQVNLTKQLTEKKLEAYKKIHGKIKSLAILKD